MNFVGTAFKKWEGLCVCITDFLPFNNQNQIIYNLTPIIYNLVLIIYKKNWIIFIKRTKARTRFIYNRGRIMYKKGGNQKKGAKFGLCIKTDYIKSGPDYIYSVF